MLSRMGRFRPQSSHGCDGWRAGLSCLCGSLWTGTAIDRRLLRFRGWCAICLSLRGGSTHVKIFAARKPLCVDPNLRLSRNSKVRVKHTGASILEFLRTFLKRSSIFPAIASCLENRVATRHDYKLNLFCHYLV